jgi:hypothetical protein
MSVQREKFSTQMDAKLLSDLRRFAKQEGRQLQSLIEEAVDRLLEEKDARRPNADVLTRAESAMAKYSDALEYLAK